MINRRDLFLALNGLAITYASDAFAQNVRFNITGIGRQTIIQNQSRISYFYNDNNIKVGAKAFIRIINSEKILELWLYSKNKYKFIREYKICANTNTYGTFLINRNDYDGTINNSLRINLFGNPNLFIQARCAAAQAISLNDTDIGELYSLLYFSLKNGQRTIPVHIFPYRMTGLNMLTKNVKSQKLKALARTYQSFESGHNLK